MFEIHSQKYLISKSPVPDYFDPNFIQILPPAQFLSRTNSRSGLRNCRNFFGIFTQQKLVEFKDILYSSPMATPRDTSTGARSSLPTVEQQFVNSLTSYPLDGIGECLSYSPSRGKICKTRNERTHPLPHLRSSSIVYENLGGLAGRSAAKPSTHYDEVYLSPGRHWMSPIPSPIIY